MFNNKQRTRETPPNEEFLKKVSDFGLRYQFSHLHLSSSEPEEKGFFEAIAVQAQTFNLKINGENIQADALRDNLIAHINQYYPTYFPGKTYDDVIEYLTGLNISIDGEDEIIISAIANMLNIFLVIISDKKETINYAGRAPGIILNLGFENGSYHPLLINPERRSNPSNSTFKLHSTNPLISKDELEPQARNSGKRKLELNHLPSSSQSIKRPAYGAFFPTAPRLSSDDILAEQVRYLAGFH
jgi:hypothetical protein